jgi:hypothetical protein
MAFNYGKTYIQEQITLLQKMMGNNEQPLKEATLVDDDIIITVTYSSIKIEWNGGTGYGKGDDYAETLQAASDDSWRRIQKSQQQT